MQGCFSLVGKIICCLLWQFCRQCHFQYSPSINHMHRACMKSLSCKHLCLPSNTAILMIFWTVAVGTTNNLVLLLTAMLVDTRPLSPDVRMIAYLMPYCMALVTMLYPLSGFIADVCCGRLKVVVINLCFILTFILLLCFTEIVVLVSKPHSINTYMIFHQTVGITAVSVILISLVFLSLDWQAIRKIQSNLDWINSQVEAPSQYLSIFILYSAWAFKLGSIPLLVSMPTLLCSGLTYSVAVIIILELLPFVIAIFLISLLVISWWKRHWFYSNRQGRSHHIRTVRTCVPFSSQ